MSRPSWDQYYIDLLPEIGKRATCDRAKTSCIFVKDKQILATGYIGSPPGFPHCDDVGHLFKKVIHEDGSISQHCVRTIHAEQNAICQAAKHGINLSGATVYCTMEPCRVCAMLLITIGVDRVVCKYRYHAGAETREYFSEAEIPLEVIDDEVAVYPDQ
jgi:dCMP deaminase